MPKRKYKAIRSSTKTSNMSKLNKMTSVISQHEDLEQYSLHWRNSRRFHKLIFATRAELTDVLRKRGLRNQEASEEEDLGLPQSPNSPNRKEKVMHHSQGSLSILSITSSDMDDEHSSLRQNTTFDSSTSSSYFNKSSDLSHGSDEVDLDLSSSSRLSHSAARHKMAVRPKRKGPSRPRRSREQTNVLPSTPEVNEDVLKHTAPNSDISEHPTKKLKSQSLPRETDSKQMFAFKSNSTTKSEIVRTPQKTTIYVNKNISKSHDFDKPVSATNIIVSSTESTITTSENKKSSGEDTSLIKKFWSRSVKKQKGDEIDVMEAEDEQEERVSECMEHKSILQINTDVTTDVHVQTRPKSGPASRQRVIPKEIEEIPIKERASIFVGQKPSDVTVKTKPIPIARTHIGSSPTKIFVHKSQEDLISKSYEKEVKAHSISPPKTSWQEQHQLKAPKICGLSSLQQKISNMDTESPSKKANVPKSNSFRVYTTTVSSESNLEKNNLPSLPNLTKISDDEDRSLKLEEEPLKYSSLTEHYTEKKRLSQEKVTELGKPKFEINDYNLVKHKKENGVEIVGVLKKKNIVLKGVEELSQSTVSNNSTNISQIEENIDKLMKSSVVTMLKNASFEEDDAKMEIVESSCTSSGSITPESSPIKESKSEINETEAVFREKRVSSVLEQFEAKMSPELKAKPPIKVVKNDIDELTKVDLRESKPPKPSTSFRISPKTINTSEVTNVEAPSSPSKIHNAIFEETEPRRSIIGENDDRKVILQRRTSVSEERLKFERRISGGATDEMKYERKKSQSEEDLDVKPKDSCLGSNNTKKSTSTSDDDDTPIVNLRKKSHEKLFGETGNNNKNDETPELMKVFARRSLKIPLDDDDNIHVQEIKKLATSNNVDSDKENQSSSEEKLDKITNNQSTTTITGQTINNNNNHQTVPTTKSSSANATITTTSVIKENNENNIPIDIKTNFVTPKPFGTPSRFSNVSNYRNSATFIETRSKNLQSKTSSSNNNLVSGNATTTTTSVSTSNNTKTLTQDVKNNNSANIRHTIGAIVNENMSKKIEANEPEEIEFKGILQRRAEWEKRAKEGFK